MNNIVNHQHIQKGLAGLGVKCGSEVMVHSSLSSFGYVEKGAMTVINAIIAQVSQEGTILMPAFVQKINGKAASYAQRACLWDIENSLSDVGLITEMFRKMPSVLRSNHPTDSICSWGRYAREATMSHKTAYGRPSPWDQRAFGIGAPWDWMYNHNVHYILMGCDFNCCSILHYVQALYAEQKGLVNKNMSEWPLFDFMTVGSLLIQKSLIIQIKVGKSIWHHIRAKVLVDESLRILESNPDMINPVKCSICGSDKGSDDYTNDEI